MPLYVMYFMHIHSRCIEYTLIFLTNLSMQWILKNNYLEQRVCHSLTYIMIYPRNMWTCLFYTWYVVLLHWTWASCITSPPQTLACACCGLLLGRLHSWFGRHCWCLPNRVCLVQIYIDIPREPFIMNHWKYIACMGLNALSVLSLNHKSFINRSK